MIFRPVKNLFTNHSIHPEGPLAIHGEPIEISVTLENTIKIPITFSDICLLWSFTGPDNGAPISNEEALFKDQVDARVLSCVNEVARSTGVPQLTINEHECSTVTFKLTPRAVGTITITGIAGQLAAQNDQECLWGKLEFESLVIRPQGPQKVEKPKQFDKRLEIQILEPAPSLAVSFSEIPTEVLAGELIPITVHYTNSGVSEISDLYIAFEHPRNFLVEGGSVETELPLSLLRDIKDFTNQNLSRDKEARKQYVSRIFDATFGDAPLQPHETRIAKLWMQVPYRQGTIELRTLIYYSLPVQYNPKLKYRLIRHSWNLMVIESVVLETNCNVTNAAIHEVGVDVAVRNLNQVHHPISTEVAIDELVLFCPKYQLRSEDIVHFCSPGNARVFQQKKMLLPTELLNFRCGLQAKLTPSSKADAESFIASRLSRVRVSESTTSSDALSVNGTNSFLMREETKFLRVFGQTTNNEEFNQIVATPDLHMTLILIWSATIKDNNGLLQRTAHGQHFVQMRHLYESGFCPRGSEQQGATKFTSDEDTFNIYDLTRFTQGLRSSKSAEIDDWAIQNM